MPATDLAGCWKTYPTRPHQPAPSLVPSPRDPSRFPQCRPTSSLSQTSPQWRRFVGFHKAKFGTKTPATAGVWVQEWLHSAASTIFQCGRLPDSPIVTLDTPIVKGLVIYGARCGTVKFYAAWVEWSGIFLGWMKIQPAVEDVDSDYATGKVLGKPLFLGISLDISGHAAFDRFVWALKQAALELGVNDFDWR